LGADEGDGNRVSLPPDRYLSPKVQRNRCMGQRLIVEGINERGALSKVACGLVDVAAIERYFREVVLSLADPDVSPTNVSSLMLTSPPQRFSTVPGRF